MLKRFILASFLVATPAFAVPVPFFGNISSSDLCGNASAGCGPTSSGTTIPVRGLPYSGQPGEILGYRFDPRRGAGIFDREPCLTAPIRPADLEEYRRPVRVTLTDTPAVEFTARATADLVQLVQGLVGTLPGELSGNIESEIRNNVRESVRTTLNIEYHRMDLRRVFLDRNLATCVAATSARERIITGVAMVRVSGAWTRNRITDLISHVEGSVGFRQMSVIARGAWTRQKQRLLSGNIPPITTIFSVAVRPGRARR